LGIVKHFPVYLRFSAWSSQREGRCARCMQAHAAGHLGHGLGRWLYR